MIKNVYGDILEAKENIICHQVNCLGVMGAGLAKQIKNRYPEVYEYYYNWCMRHNKEELLGRVILVQTEQYSRYIANVFGQIGIKSYKDGCVTNYEALENGLLVVKDEAKKCGWSVAIPYKIGCGLAGGNWYIVHSIIQKVFSDYDVTIYRLRGYNDR